MMGRHSIPKCDTININEMYNCVYIVCNIDIMHLAAFRYFWLVLEICFLLQVLIRKWEEYANEDLEEAGGSDVLDVSCWLL